MGAETAHRRERRHDNETDDNRSRPARDRDRVLYSAAFRRLAGVTQVVAPRETHIFHNRLTHSLEVAQIGRRIAERLVNPKTCPSKLKRKLGELRANLDPDVVEAACLVHDLGHPPFGHIGEDELSNLAKTKGNVDGFEGNAQSFRIVTRLAVHRDEYDGLDLTRATLNATLKYPWTKDLNHPNRKEHHKFGTYTEDEPMFDWVRQYSPPRSQCLEAQIMDFADDVANSVHDIIDFYRAGLLPLAHLYFEKGEFHDFIARWAEDAVNPMPEELRGKGRQLRKKYRDKFQNLLYMFIEGGEYIGTKPQRAQMRNAATSKIRQYDNNATVEFGNGDFKFVPRKEDSFEIAFLKRVFFHYLISNPRLTTQQYGQRQIITFLFRTYFDATGNVAASSIIPNRFRHIYEGLGSAPVENDRARLAIDIISSFTDQQALTMFGRLNGHEPGAISDIVLW